jgi:hypothetical protein
MNEQSINKEVDKYDYYKSTDTETKQSTGNGKEKLQDRIKKQNDINYGRSKELYNEKLLKKQLRQHFITIPHTEQDHLSLMENIKKASKNMKYICIAKEKHTEGGEHYHLLITASRSITVAQLHKRIMETQGNIRGSINYQQVQSLKAVETYVKKDGNYKEWGSIATQKYTKDTKDEVNEDLNEIYTNDKTLEENLEIIKAKQPAYYTQYKKSITEELKIKDEKQYEKFKAPVYNTENTTLKPYQKRIWELINTQPKQRRIIWVNGRPGTGKSFMFNYIEENFKYGIYSAGSTASLDNAVYGYEEQGAIAWDIPLNYKYDEMGDALSSTIEKFSDFGQYLTSRKYQGKKVQVLGHVIVFANRPVLPQLKHRDIIEINAHDDLTEVEKLAVWNTRKKLINGVMKYQVMKETPHNGIETTHYNYENLPSYIKEFVYNDTTNEDDELDDTKHY